MTPRQRMVYEVTGLLRKLPPLDTKEECVRAVEELMSEHTQVGDPHSLGYRFDALGCAFSRFATSVWTVYRRIKK